MAERELRKNDKPTDKAVCSYCREAIPRRGAKKLGRRVFCSDRCKIDFVDHFIARVREI